MKLYVIKNKETRTYQTQEMEYIADIGQADLFLDYEVAQAYCPSCCEVVEVVLMEKKDFDNHTDQVRKRVCDEIKEVIESEPIKYLDYDYNDYAIDYNLFKEELKEIGGRKGGG